MDLGVYFVYFSNCPGNMVNIMFIKPMSITVLSGSPLVATPVYNKMLYKVSGSLIAQPNYRYVCDVKNPAGTTLARLKCDKLPTTNFGFFDVQKVVETLVAPTAPSLTQTE